MQTNKVCVECQNQFVLYPEDFALFEKVGVTEPTCCSFCRQRRRFMWRNERTLFKSKCASTGKACLSMYGPETKLKVFEQKEWWSDSWNGLKYGRDFDFNRPFFEQFAELKLLVPHLNLCNDSVSISCDYANQTTYLKNCYLVYDTDRCENCYYIQTGKDSRYCMDCVRPFDCELCYECVDCTKSYNIKYSQNCENCTDSYYLKNCKNLRNCFGCINLQHKEYCYFNEQLTKGEYEKRLNDWKKMGWAQHEKFKAEVHAWYLNFLLREHQNLNTENCVGDYIENSKNTFYSFDIKGAQDCRYCTNLTNGAKDCSDYDVWGEKAELIYECITVGEDAFNCKFSVDCWDNVSNLTYCQLCVHSSDLFGCIGLKKNKYCILNKQYTKEEYAALMPKIVEHLKKTGEWGEFFPGMLSLFPYNDTIAQTYHPLTRDEAHVHGYLWRDQMPEISGHTTSAVSTCIDCHKPFKVIDQEMQFYKQHELPVPHRCSDCRHQERMKLRNPRMIFERNCSECNASIYTTSPSRSAEKVVCEKCYRKLVY